MQSRSALHDLAALVGIVPQYLDQAGSETRHTSDETRISILAAMGIDASTDGAARGALDRLEARERDRLLPPVRVVRADDPELRLVVLRVPESVIGAVEWVLEVHLEGGDTVRREGRAMPEWNGTLTLLELPAPLPPGYHTLRALARLPEGERAGEQSLIVVPSRAPSVSEVAGRERVAGVIANLYTVRSERNWGIGDLSDLRALAGWTAEWGGAFVGVNPLHALGNEGGDISPYSPLSRVFRNPLYLDPEAVPELAGSDEARRLVEEAAPRLAELRAAERIDYEAVASLKMPVLRALFRAFAGAPIGRREELERYRAEQGEPLWRFATFQALAASHGRDFRRWPEAYRAPMSAAVEGFRAEHREEVEFHGWLQWELDRQLAEAARGSGLSIGLYQDLAIGTAPAGADVWSEPGLFVRGVGIGAPPDGYSATGQNWGLPPIDPRALREDGFRYWIRLVRASLRHSGALRIDHAIGLFRQFWIPDGMDGTGGAYLRFPSAEMLGILALEAQRHRAVVVGEDLGTVPPEVVPALRRWGIHSSRVLYFERDDQGFRAAAEYEPMALATANTHDMPTLAGFWRGRDIELKREVGLIDSDDSAERQREEREEEKDQLLQRLAADGALPEPAEPDDPAALRGAVHAFLCQTPAALVGFALDDLAGEVEPVNLPGVPPDQFSAWTRRMATPVERLAEDPTVGTALRCEGRSG